MVSKSNISNNNLQEQQITADYILNLYKIGRDIKNTKEKKLFLKDVKKLIPYIGKSVLLEMED